MAFPLFRLSAFCAALALAGFSHAGEGGAVFRDNCAACHQANAGGAPGVAPPLTGPHWGGLQDPKEHYILQVLATGLTGKITVKGELFNGVMPSFAHLEAGDIAAVANYLLALNEVVTPVLTATDVQEARAKKMTPAQIRALRRSLLKE